MRSARDLLVIPCFHESPRLGRFLPQLLAGLEQLGGVYVLVVDDGSGPLEREALQSLIQAQRHQLRLEVLWLPQNLGKGGAVRAGWDHALGLGRQFDWLGFVDADGACCAAEVCRLHRSLAALPEYVAGCFASRVRMLGRSVNRLWQRHVLGRVFATMVSRGLQIPAYDTQCGLKWVRASAYQMMAPRLECRGFAFDVEWIAALLDAGFALREEPIDWTEIAGGKVRLWRDSWSMGWQLLDIARRRRQWRREGWPKLKA
jgi:glycosyltransferase involved in cell wall biosynthesis